MLDNNLLNIQGKARPQIWILGLGLRLGFVLFFFERLVRLCRLIGLLYGAISLIKLCRSDDQMRLHKANRIHLGDFWTRRKDILILWVSSPLLLKIRDLRIGSCILQ